MTAMSRWYPVVTLLGLLLTLSAQAALFVYPPNQAQLIMDVPPDWQVQSQDQDRVRFASPSGNIQAFLLSVREDRDQAINLLVAETELVLKYDVDKASYFGGFSPLRLNGMPATQLKARGYHPDAGFPVGADFLIFNPGGNFWGLFYAIYHADTPEDEQNQLVEMFRSISPA